VTVVVGKIYFLSIIFFILIDPTSKIFGYLDHNIPKLRRWCTVNFYLTMLYQDT